MKLKLPKPLLWGGLIILLLGGTLYLAWEHIWPLLEPAWNFLADRAAMRRFIESYGPLAPLVFMSLQAAQVLIAPIPGELTGLLGGYVFGWQQGVIYSSLALSAGSMMSFGLARLLGRSLVERWVPASVLKKIDEAMKRQGVLTCFILYLLPGFPKDYLCLALGLTRLNWRMFLLICAVGRLPGTLMLSLQGAMVYQENYWDLLWVSLIALVFLAPAFIFREKIYALSLKLNK
jgi:uncharacterized membrane protein YdjX (TVP38/TMEM64 family)